MVTGHTHSIITKNYHKGYKRYSSTATGQSQWSHSHVNEVQTLNACACYSKSTDCLHARWHSFGRSALRAPRAG